MLCRPTTFSNKERKIKWALTSESSVTYKTSTNVTCFIHLISIYWAYARNLLGPAQALRDTVSVKLLWKQTNMVKIKCQRRGENLRSQEKFLELPNILMTREAREEKEASMGETPRRGGLKSRKCLAWWDIWACFCRIQESAIPSQGQEADGKPELRVYDFTLVNTCVVRCGPVLMCQ